MERGHPNSKIEADLALHRHWLERHGSIGTSDQNVGAEPGTNRRFPAHPHVVTCKETGTCHCSGDTSQTITPPPMMPMSSPNFVMTPP